MLTFFVDRDLWRFDLGHPKCTSVTSLTWSMAIPFTIPHYFWPTSI